MFGVLSTLSSLSVLWVCEVWGVPMTSVTTHVYSALSIISSVPIILAVPVFPVSAVYFSVSSVSMLLLCFFLICIRVPTTATGLALMSKTIFLVAGLIAIKE